MKHQYIKYVVLITIFNLVAPANGNPTVDEDTLEQWLNDDSELKALAVNEGELTFIQPVYEKRVLHSINRIKLTPESLSTGWAQLEQCYSQLDPVAEIEVVYKYKAMRNLTVSSFKNIGRATIQDQSVFLEQVEHNARLCISADIQVVNQINDSSYEIKQGPFHRKFLDGYYPYHVTLEINYPEGLLNLQYIDPPGKNYQQLKDSPGRLLLDTWFEGILKIRIQFNAAN